MTKPRIPHRPLRKRVFVAIEGKDGHAFMTWIQKCLEAKNIPVYIDIHSVGGGGYEIMLREAKRLKENGRQKSGKYRHGSFLFVDQDRANSGDDISLVALQRQAAKEFKIVAMQPKFEAVLLFLLSNQQTSMLSDNTLNKKLREFWPDYKKPITAARIFENKFASEACFHLKNIHDDWDYFFHTLLGS